MNKVWKVLLPLVLVVALLTAAMPVFAAKSPTTKAIGSVKISSSTYTGKKLTPKITVYDKAGKKINSKYYTYKTNGSISAGKHKVVVTAKAPYTGKKTAYWTINKAKNPFTIKVGKTSFKRNTKKNQTTSIKVSGVKGGGAKLGKWKSTTSKVYVKGGKIIIKKGFYGSATLSISTKETKNYKATKKSVKITVKKK